MNFRTPGALLAGVLIILLATGGGVWWLLRSPEVALFDGLDATQLNAVAAELDRASVRYHLDREVGSVSVAPDDASRARLAVMSSGNAFRETPGFELFNGSDFGMTEFAQRINYQRAMEGELARTLGALDEVKYARVHLVLPEHGLFRSRQQEPRAAITVFAEDSVTLTQSQVRGIQRLTASSVPELQEKNVTVLDESGVVLSASGDDDQPEVGARLAQKQAIEKYFADKVRNVLAKALGVERFAVSIDVSLDYSQKTTTTERILTSPAGAEIRHLKETTRTGASEEKGDERLREVDYNTGREVEQITHGAGAIRRIQAGVIIDEAVAGADVEQLQALISAALGTDSSRGDRVTVIRHNIAAQRVLEQAALPTAAATARAPWRSLPETAALLPERWQWAVAIGLLVAVSGGAVAQIGMRRRRVLRQQQLRKQLKLWVDREPATVEQP
jgi:flagellar M-ring protein FliF